ncbi:ATP-binding cassette domain-containing protein [Actinomadura madurae]|uniref:ABC transporter ATP-binding protein/permease n=1 Tax=Actinomadura madurae TaxID=1993 RepID=UPI00399C452B
MRPRRRVVCSAPAAGTVLLAVPVAVAVAGPWLAPHDPVATSAHVLAAPHAGAWLGTDHLGRDVLSRVLAGGRGPVGVAFGALAVAEVIGVALGLAAGQSRRAGRAAVLGVAEVFLAVPSLLLLAALVAGFGRSWTLLLAASVIVMVPSLIPVIATRTTALAGRPWALAALLAGERRGALLRRELLPNLWPVIAADAGIRLLTAVFMVSTAGFLGFGPRPPAPDWGLMIFEARATMGLQPWPVIAPALLIACFALGANLLAHHGVARTGGRPGRPLSASAPVPAPVPAAARPAGAGTVAEIRGLTVVDAGGRAVLDAADLAVPRGGAVAIVGPSGAGKSTLGLALLGHVRAGLGVTAGTVTVDGTDLIGASPAELRAVRRSTVRHVPQDPAAALTPTMRAGRLLAEALEGTGADASPAAAKALLDLVRLPTGRGFLRRRPHELSGGQRRRLALAMALAGRPRLIVLDEPTAGLDPRTRDEVLAELGRVRAATGCALVMITHDPLAAARLCERTVGLWAGRTAILAEAPAAGPVTGPSSAPRNGDGPALLSVRALGASYTRSGGAALRGVDLDVAAGECVAVLGPSGAGKTTLARCVTGLLPPESGTVLLDGRPLAGTAARRPPGQRRRIALVFQDPDTSLNPAHTVGALLARPAALRGADGAAEAIALLDEVGLPRGHRHRRPAELSGGERQRVAIARALAARPHVLVCDEVTSALDPGTTAGICALLDAARARHGLALLVVTHDLAVARRLAHRVAVLDSGRIVRLGPAAVLAKETPHG